MIIRTTYKCNEVIQYARLFFLKGENILAIMFAKIEKS